MTSGVLSPLSLLLETPTAHAQFFDAFGQEYSTQGAAAAADTKQSGEAAQARQNVSSANVLGSSIAICGATGLGGLGAAYLSGLLSNAVAGTALSVIMVNANTPIAQAIQQGQLTVQTVLKSIAYCAAKTLARKITADIVQWSNTGFQGKPTFVTNTKKFLTDIADEEVGSFIHGTPLAFVCSPFKVSLQVALSRTFLAQRRPVCTLTQVTRNINGFLNDFRQGGWPAWLEFTTVPANNVFGTYLTASLQLQANIAGRQQRDLGKVLSNAGFRDITKCVRPGPGNTCAQYGIVTPGSVVSAQLNEALPEGLKELRLADDFGEIVNALIVGLLTKALTGSGGLRGVSESGYYTPSGNFVSESYIQTLQKEDVREVGALKVSVAQQIDVATNDEEAYLTLKQDSKRKINAAQVAVSEVGKCYTQKSTDTSLTSEQRDTATSRAAVATTTVNSLQLRHISLDAKIDAAIQNLRILADMKNHALIATSVAELESLTYETENFKSSGQLQALKEGLQAKVDYDQLLIEMDAAIAQAGTDLATCQAFPPPTP